MLKDVTHWELESMTNEVWVCVGRGGGSFEDDSDF